MTGNNSLNVDYSLEAEMLSFARTCNVDIELAVHQTNLEGRGIIHVSNSPCETPRHHSTKHLVIIHLKSEIRSERRLDKRLQVENPHVGDIAIIPAKVDHWHVMRQDSAGIVLNLEPEILSAYAPEAVDPDKIEIIPTFTQPDPLIFGIGLALKTALESSQYNRFYGESLYDTLFIHLLQRYATRQPLIREYNDGLPRYKLKRAIAYIQAYLTENLSLDAMATEVGMSRFYFCRLFKKSTGITPYQYLIKCRIERAKVLLRQRKLSITDIALEVGFSNQSHFTKHFKRLIGTTPKVYRDR